MGMTLLSPLRAARDISKTAPIDFEIVEASGIDSTTLNVWVDGLPAVLLGVAQAGFTLGPIPPAGAILDDGVTYQARITPAANYRSREVDVVIQISQGGGTPTYLETFRFFIRLDHVSDLRARSEQDGKKVYLTWTNSVDIERIRVVRSRSNYCRFETDPGDILYDGVPIETLTDGPLSSVPPQEGVLYYYTIFAAFDSGATAGWTYSPDGRVAGLCLRDYQAKDPDYVFRLLPREVRRRDGESTRGDSQDLTKKYCRVIQGTVNVFRGHLEVLQALRDPDDMPAGRIGEADNQTGILEAASLDMGMSPERTYDAGVLRRIIASIIPAYERKGSCNGFVMLFKLMAGWDIRCDEMIEPRCGVHRLFTTWDGESYILRAGTVTLGAGYVDVTGFTRVDTGAVAVPPDYAAPMFVLDDVGTFACVDSVAPIMGGYRVTFKDAAATLRSNIQLTVAGNPGPALASAIANASKPWQFPHPAAAPVFNEGAYAGKRLKSLVDNSEYDIYYQPVTGNWPLMYTTPGQPPDGDVQIAGSFTAGNPVPGFKLYVGEFSLTYDPAWELRLRAEEYEGPWSFITGGGSVLSPYYAPTPADVVFWVDGVHELIGTVDSVDTNTLTDVGAGWTINEWRGYFVIPNWNQRRIFRIAGNSATQLFVQDDDGQVPVDATCSPGTTYVILSEESAVFYERMNFILGSFVPYETQPFIKFE